MSQFNNPLDHVRVASPCKADWKQMIGTERVRFCAQCNLNVYNLSSMTKTEAESLIAQTEGRLCARFYRRSDGSILTRDCPVGLQAIRRRVSYLAKAVSAAVISFLAGIGVYRVAYEPQPTSLMGVIAVNPEPITVKEATTPLMGRAIFLEQGDMPLRVEEVDKISPAGKGKHHFTAAPKSRRKKGHAS